MNWTACCRRKRLEPDPMVAAIPLGLALGLSLGAVGGGGAVLAVPLLVYLLGEDVHAATTTSLAVVTAAAFAAGAAQMGRARVCWPQVALFAPAAVAGALVGTFANQAVSGTAVLIGFVPVLFAAAGMMWRRAGRDAEPAEDVCPALKAPRTLAAGAMVGALTGFFGVGGGFLVVPMLALGMRFPLRRAIGTSLVIVALVSLAALAAHLWQSAELDSDLTLGMAAGCVAGALVGTTVGERLPQSALAHAFALLVAITGMYVLLATVLGGGPPGT
jgi:uncharacterized membrane protein YfcA